MSNMREIAELVQEFDNDLRMALKNGRSGLFRRSDDSMYIQSAVSLGGKYTDEAVMIFADESDLDLFYETYLKTD